jgi:hypothetical protein
MFVNAAQAVDSKAKHADSTAAAVGWYALGVLGTAHVAWYAATVLPTLATIDGMYSDAIDYLRKSGISMEIDALNTLPMSPTAAETTAVNAVQEIAVVAQTAETAEAASAAKPLPTMVFDYNTMPLTAQNMWHAMQAGRENVLTRGGWGLSLINRYLSLRGIPRIKGFWRDEFPYASTVEGGAGAWIGHTPAAEQRLQGQIIRAFYRLHNIRAGDQYRVHITNHAATALTGHRHRILNDLGGPDRPD